MNPWLVKVGDCYFLSPKYLDFGEFRTKNPPACE